MRGSWCLVAGVCLVVVACGGYDSGGSTSPTPPGHDSVTVANNHFTPASVIPNGAGVVVWTWASGGVAHNVTFEDAIAGSGNKTSGNFSQTFVTPGTYRYRCTIHSSGFGIGMSGSVVVSAPTPAGDPDPAD